MFTAIPIMVDQAEEQQGPAGQVYTVQPADVVMILDPNCVEVPAF